MSYVQCPDCNKRIVDKRRYPVQPLADWMGMSLSQACITVGISGSTQKTARCHGLGRQSIESVAGKLRVHPSEIWPEVVAHDIEDASISCAADNCSERFVPHHNGQQHYCSLPCRRRMQGKRRRQRSDQQEKAAARLRAWKEANAEAHREYQRRYQRRYMREWRAKKREGRAA